MNMSRLLQQKPMLPWPFLNALVLTSRSGASTSSNGLGSVPGLPSSASGSGRRLNYSSTSRCGYGKITSRVFDGGRRVVRPLLTKCKVAVRLADREEKGDVVRTRKREEKEQHRHASDHEQVRLSVRLDRCAM